MFPRGIIQSDTSRTRKVYIVLALPLIAASFYAVEHRTAASLTVETSSDIRFDGSDNFTADRLDEVNAGSTTFRLFLAAFGFMGLVLPHGDKLRWRSPLLWAIGMYTSYLACSVLWSVGPEFSAFKLMVVLVFLVASLGIARQATLQELGRLFSTVCVGYLLWGVAVELSLGTFRVVGDYRFTGTSHPNTQAVYGSIACLGAVLFRPESKRFSFVTMFVFAVGLTCVILTKSRTSLAAMLIGLTAMQGLRARGNQRVLLVTGGLVAVATAVLTLSLLGGQQRTRLGSAAAMGRTDDLGSLTGRLPLWEELLETVAERPWFGNGYMAFWTPERVEYLGDVFNWEIPHGHNMYLDVLIDGGVVGLCFFVGMFLVAIVTSVRYHAVTHDLGAAFVFGLLVFALVHGIGESFYKLYGLPNFILITLLLRFAWSRPRIDIRAEKQLAVTKQDIELVAGGAV